MKEIENKKTSKISNAILEEENLSTRISDDQLQGEFNLDYSRRSRESRLKPHSYCILNEYCFSLIK